MMEAIGDILADWEYANPVPDRSTRYEIDTVLQGVWVLLALAWDAQHARHIVVSLYRKDVRAIHKRIERGRLRPRREE